MISFCPAAVDDWAKRCVFSSASVEMFNLQSVSLGLQIFVPTIPKDVYDNIS